MNLSYQQERQCRKFAGQLQQLYIIAPLDCDDLHIRSVAAALRDIEQRYSKYLKIAGFQESQLIKSFSWIPNMLTPDVEAIYWGDAYEVPVPGYIIAQQMGIPFISDDGMMVLDGPVSNSYHFASNNSSYNFTTGINLPYEEKNVAIHQFFNEPIIYWHGKILTRRNIIEYAAYGLAFIHTDHKNYDTKYKHERDILESINNSPSCFRRNNTLYMLLGIARSILSADCTQKYLQKFN